MIMRLAQTFIALGMSLYALDSSAQIFKLDYTPAAGMDPTVTSLLSTQIQSIQTDINDGLPGAGTPNRLMEGMVNSSVMAGKGIGTDYASGMKVFLIGAGVGAGVDLTKTTNPKSDISGAGVQTGIVIGTNLSWMDTERILGLDTNRLNIFANFMSYSLKKSTGDTSVDGKLTSFGFHASYDWITAKGSKLFGWGGIKITTGYEQNSTKLALTSSINKTLDYTYSGYSYNANILASPSAQIDVASTSIPLNISTSVNFLYLLSLYGGLGMDYNTGKATGKGNLNSTPSTISCSPTNVSACPGGTAGTITTSANIDGSAKALPFLYRGFAGIQFNLPFLRIFVQADKSLSNNLLGATAGVRIVY